MKRLLALLAICLPIYLFAQGFGSFSHDQPYFAKDAAAGAADDFPLISTIGYRWVASDVGTNNTAVSTWTDRIQGFRLLASTNQPIATTNGVTFYRTNWLWLEQALNGNFGDTDLGDYNSNKWSYMIVCSAATLAGDRMWILSAGYGTDLPFFRLQWDGTWYNGGVGMGLYTANKNVEVFSMGRKPGVLGATWKNGTWISSSLGTSNLWALVGTSGDRNLNWGLIGTIKEIVVWTNSTYNSTSYVNQVHQYVTNHYSNF